MFLSLALCSFSLSIGVSYTQIVGNGESGATSIIRQIDNIDYTYDANSGKYYFGDSFPDGYIISLNEDLSQYYKFRFIWVTIQLHYSNVVEGVSYSFDVPFATTTWTFNSNDNYGFEDYNWRAYCYYEYGNLPGDMQPGLNFIPSSDFSLVFSNASTTTSEGYYCPGPQFTDYGYMTSNLGDYGDTSGTLAQNSTFSVVKYLRIGYTGFSYIPETIWNTLTSRDEDITEAYNNGASDGYNTGYHNGYDSGYDEGWQTGFESGKQVSYESGISTEIFANIIQVGMMPVNIFLQILNFEVFGINIGAIVSGLLTLAITLIILRTIKGNSGGGGSE